MIKELRFRICDIDDKLISCSIKRRGLGDFWLSGSGSQTLDLGSK